MKQVWRSVLRIAVIINVLSIGYEWVTVNRFPWWLYSAGMLAFLTFLENRERHS